MARALLGHLGTPGEQALAYEVARLRRRVQELEAELAEARRSADLDLAASLELHRITADAEPALA
jgi:50S ribosomal subunit-associated GTPase HflX